MTAETPAVARQRYEVTYIFTYKDSADRDVRRPIRLTVQIWGPTEWGTVNIAFSALSFDEKTGGCRFNPWRNQKLEGLQRVLGDHLLQTKFGLNDEEAVTETDFLSVHDLVEHLASSI